MPARIRLVTLPSNDPAFRALAVSLLESGRDGAEGPEGLERRLRATYFDAIVRVQDDLARISGDEVTWYAYRARPTAHRVEPATQAEPWWDAPGLPWIVIDDGGVYRDGSDAAFALLGGRRDTVVGVRVGVRSRDLYAGAEDDAGDRWRLMLEQPDRVHRITLPAADGGHVLVETRTVANGAGPGLHRIVARIVPIDGAGEAR